MKVIVRYRPISLYLLFIFLFTAYGGNTYGQSKLTNEQKQAIKEASINPHQYFKTDQEASDSLNLRSENKKAKLTKEEKKTIKEASINPHQYFKTDQEASDSLNLRSKNKKAKLTKEEKKAIKEASLNPHKYFKNLPDVHDTTKG